MSVSMPENIKDFIAAYPFETIIKETLATISTLPEEEFNLYQERQNYCGINYIEIVNNFFTTVINFFDINEEVFYSHIIHN